MNTAAQHSNPANISDFGVSPLTIMCRNSITSRIFIPIIGVIRLTSPLCEHRKVAQLPIAKNMPVKSGCQSRCGFTDCQLQRSVGRNAKNIRKLVVAKMEVGDSLPSAVDAFTKSTLRQYAAAATGSNNSGE